MKPIRIAALLFSSLLLACGPNAGTNADDDDDNNGSADGGPSSHADAGPCVPSGSEGSVDSCSDGKDNDCDEKWDCQDPDCSGVGECPVCGEVETSAGAGIVLPDGVIGATCSTDAECTDPATPNCVESECHASYTSTLDVIGFGDNQTFDNPNIIRSVCVNIEHSWLRDMEIRLIAPDGQILRLQKFLGRTGGEIYLGQANDCDEGAPVAGTGASYCWTPAATNPPMLDYANAGGAMSSATSCLIGTAEELPPGDYSAADPWTSLMGTHLNGQWKFVVTDLWPIDNGFLFDWTIQFDPQEVGDCSGPIIN